MGPRFDLGGACCFFQCAEPDMGGSFVLFLHWHHIPCVLSSCNKWMCQFALAAVGNSGTLN